MNRIPNAPVSSQETQYSVDFGTWYRDVDFVNPKDGEILSFDFRTARFYPVAPAEHRDGLWYRWQRVFGPGPGRRWDPVVEHWWEFGEPLHVQLAPPVK